jgi:hypothetical protein
VSVAILYNVQLSQVLPSNGAPPPLDVWPFQKTIFNPLLACGDDLITITTLTYNEKYNNILQDAKSATRNVYTLYSSKKSFKLVT